MMRINYQDSFLGGIKEMTSLQTFWKMARFLLYPVVYLLALLVAVLNYWYWLAYLPLLVLTIFYIRDFLDIKFGYVDIREQELYIHSIFKSQTIPKDNIFGVKICRTASWNWQRRFCNQTAYINIEDPYGETMAATLYTPELYRELELIIDVNLKKR